MHRSLRGARKGANTSVCLETRSISLDQLDHAKSALPPALTLPPGGPAGSRHGAVQRFSSGVAIGALLATMGVLARRRFMRRWAC